MALLSLRSELCPFLRKQLVKKVNLNVKIKEKEEARGRRSHQERLNCYLIKDTARR